MATLFHTGQVLVGQIGKYKIVKQLKKAVWLARCRPYLPFHRHVMLAYRRQNGRANTQKSRSKGRYFEECAGSYPRGQRGRCTQDFCTEIQAHPTANIKYMQVSCDDVSVPAPSLLIDRNALSDVKADNVLVNEKSDETNRFTDIQLADMDNSYPGTHEYAREGQPIGASMWTSPEVLMHMPWDTKTEIWSFGTLVSANSRNFVSIVT
jgi:hypothetical protein